MPSLRPDRTVVISLDRRPDRLSRFRLDWAASGWGAVLGTPQVVSAVDGRGVTGPGYLSAAAYGCWASHVQVLTQALDDGLGSVLVFEDDAVPQPGSVNWLKVVLGNLPEHAGGLWLDARMLGPDNRFAHGSVGTRRLRRPPLRTHAYLLRRPLLERLVPVISARPAHIDRLFHYQELADLYAAVPSLVEQTDVDPTVRSAWRSAYLQDPHRSNVSRWLRLLDSIT